MQCSPTVNSVGNLDEIVDFSTPLDQRPAECRAVDRHIGSQFHVVLDDDAAKLRGILMASLMLHVSEPVGSDHGSTVHDHSRAREQPSRTTTLGYRTESSPIVESDPTRTPG